MKVSKFIDELGDLLQEDFVTAVLWTKAELLGYLRQIVREFSVKTLIVDKDIIAVVNATTGEADVPKDFNSAFFVQFDQEHKDIVQLGDLDFIDADWILGGTATSPQAASVFGSGDNAVVRFVPVPSVVSGSLGSGVLTEPKISDSAGGVWLVSSVNGGSLVTTSSTGTTTEVSLRGVSKEWQLNVDNTGKLSTTILISSVPEYSTAPLNLVDASNSIVYTVIPSSLGVLTTVDLIHGLTTSVTLNGTSQEFTAGANSSNANYGIVVDTYTTGTSTAPSVIFRADKPIGEVLFLRTSEGAAHVWYKGHIQDVPNLESELFVSDAMIPVLKHGVLGLALAHEGDGQDLEKSKLLTTIFTAECDAIKKLFGRR